MFLHFPFDIFRKAAEDRARHGPPAAPASGPPTLPPATASHPPPAPSSISSAARRGSLPKLVLPKEHGKGRKKEDSESSESSEEEDDEKDELDADDRILVDVVPAVSHRLLCFFILFELL
jgi:hypothetical protein